MLEPGRFTISIDEWPYSPKFQDFAIFLGFTPDRDAKGINWKYDERIAKKIEEIYLWGRIMTGSSDHEEIKKAVYSLRQMLGVNYIGKTLVDELWQYIQFDTHYKNKKRELIEKALIKQEEIKEEKEEEKEKIEKKPPAPIKPIKEVKTKLTVETKSEIPIKEIPKKELKSEPIEI